MLRLIASEYLIHFVQADLCKLLSLYPQLLDHLLILCIVQVDVLDRWHHQWRLLPPATALMFISPAPFR